MWTPCYSIDITWTVRAITRHYHRWFRSPDMWETCRIHTSGRVKFSIIRKEDRCFDNGRVKFIPNEAIMLSQVKHNQMCWEILLSQDCRNIDGEMQLSIFDQSSKNLRTNHAPLGENLWKGFLYNQIWYKIQRRAWVAPVKCPRKHTSQYLFMCRISLRFWFCLDTLSTKYTT